MRAEARLGHKYVGLCVRLLPVIYPFSEVGTPIPKHVCLINDKLRGTLFFMFRHGPSPKFQDWQRQTWGFLRADARPGHKSLGLWFRLSPVIYQFPEGWVPLPNRCIWKMTICWEPTFLEISTWALPKNSWAGKARPGVFLWGLEIDQGTNPLGIDCVCYR